MNAFYKISNALVATLFASTMGFAIFKQSPALWDALDNTFGAGCVIVVGLVGILTIGFVTLETRKA